MKSSPILILILLLAAALRFYNLGFESFWVDELITAKRIETNVSNILLDWHNKTQGPLYYLITKAWSGVAGMDEAALRFPSAIFGVLAVLAIYHLGRKLFSVQAGLFAALFLAVNPFAIQHSQNARPYELFLLLSICSFYFLVKILREFRTSDAVFYVLFTAGALYTHAYGPFLLLSHVAGYFIFRRAPGYYSAQNHLRAYLITLGVLLFIYLPQLARFAATFLFKAVSKSDASWIPEPNFAALWNGLLHFFMWDWLGAAVLILIVTVLIVRISSDKKSRAPLYFLLAVIICVSFVPWLVSKIITPIYVSRYATPTLVALILILGWAVAGFQGLPRAILTLFLIALTALPLYHYHTKIDHDPWRQTNDYMRPIVKTGDVIFPVPGWTSEHFKWYFDPPDDVKIQDVRKEEELAQAMEGASRVWLVESYNVPRKWRDMMTENGFQSIQAMNINKDLVLNPYRYWVSDINVTLYTFSHTDTSESITE